MPGPPPKIDPVRRNARTGPRMLPAGGRQGKPPAWPFEGRHFKGEAEAWRALWVTPQAAAWEELGWTRVVARYCRYMLWAQQPLATAQTLSHVVALEDRLGLTPKAMRMLLWEISSDEVAEKRETKGVRGRLQAVG